LSWIPDLGTSPALAWPLSRAVFEIERLRLAVASLDHQLTDPSLTHSHSDLRRLYERRSTAAAAMAAYECAAQALEDVGLWHELGAGDESAAALQLGLAAIEELERIAKPRGEHDHRSAYLSLQSGAGGTEAMDFTGMLLRMYLRWCDRAGFRAELLEEQAGEIAGLRSATLHVQGEGAYGRLAFEQGVHRMQRFSPFGNGERQTSFASVEVTPEFDDDPELRLPVSELRFDTFCSSGPGGQHVNKNESGVRITHLPSGISVRCQQGRSQHANRSLALALLTSRVQQIREQARMEERRRLGNQRRGIQRGQQIRTYTLAPYRMIKDLRTGVVVHDVQAVLDGELEALQGDGYSSWGE
jgi:peptide chain release factor 2